MKLHNYITYNGVGGDEKFIKYTSSFNIYYGLKDIINYDLILRYKAMGNILQNNGQISLPEKLFIGGIGSIRGFEPYSLSPYTNENQIITYLGGTKSLTTSVEASIPLVDKIRLSLFYDYGMIGKNNFDEIQKSSYGLSLEWYSPIGPINLIFPKAIDNNRFDRVSTFEFTMGRSF